MPPALASLLLWYDLTDTATLWQNTGGTTAVTTDGDPIARIDNKGTDGGNLQQSTGASQPAYDVDGLGGCIFDGGDFLFGTPSTGIAGLDRVIAVVYNLDASMTGSDFCFSWKGQQLSLLVPTTGRPQAWDNIGVTLAVGDLGLGTTQSVMADHITGGASQSELWANLETPSVTGTGNTNFGEPADGEFVISGEDSTPSSNWLGNIMEICVWTGVDGSDLIEAWKVYTAAKYGVIWA
jgi:hypothetical protein